ncbi:hypothetical protein LTR28_008099 [Elasticomyces elasticus]|nr:hypothetical protein LTR28_008099 [Elasticomyces elasticus]
MGSGYKNRLLDGFFGTTKPTAYSDFKVGTIAFASFGVIPALRLAPTQVQAQQWEKVFWIGASTAPPLALMSSLAFGYLANQGSPPTHRYQVRADISAASKVPQALSGTAIAPTTPFYLLTTSAVIIPAIVPYTLFLMKNTNNKLHAKAAKYRNTIAGEKNIEAGMPREETVEGLVSKWYWLNMLRAVMVGSGAAMGLVAVLGDW